VFVTTCNILLPTHETYRVGQKLTQQMFCIKMLSCLSEARLSRMLSYLNILCTSSKKQY